MWSLILRPFFDSLFEAIAKFFEKKQRDQDIFDAGVDQALANGAKNDIEALKHAQKNADLFNDASDDELDRLLRESEPGKNTPVQN